MTAIPEAIDHIIGERKSAQGLAMRAVPEPTVGGKREGSGRKPEGATEPPKNQGSNAILKRDAAYWSRRIARDAPEILERMKGGR